MSLKMLNLSVLLVFYLATLGCCAREKSCTDCAVDLILVIDSHLELQPSQEEQALKNFLSNLLEQIPVAENQTEIGVIEFKENVEILAPLGTDRALIELAIQDITLTMGQTDMYGALDKTMQMLLSSANRDNSVYKDIVLLITDGRQSANHDAIIQMANEIRHVFGAKIIVVGVSQVVDAGFLSEVADNGELYFNVDSFSVLASILCRIKIEACLPPPKKCDLDVAFAIDMSGSVQTASAVQKVRNFGNKTMMNMMERSPRMRQALIEFKDSATLKANLNNYNTSFMRKQVLSLKPGGWTCTACALKIADEKVFNGMPESGDRTTASNVLVLLTDGLPTRTLSGTNIKENAVDRSAVENEVTKLAQNLTDKGVAIVCVIVKGKMSQSWDPVTNMCTSVLSVDDFDGLTQVMDSLSNKVCEVPNVFRAMRNMKRLIEKSETVERYIDVNSKSEYSRVYSDVLKEKMASLMKEYLNLDN